MRLSILELKEFARLDGWPRAMAQEILTCREHCPALEAEVKRLYEENLQLKATLCTYVEQQAKMFDERRQSQHDMEVAQLTLKDVTATVQRLVAEREGSNAE